MRRCQLCGRFVGIPNVGVTTSMGHYCSGCAKNRWTEIVAACMGDGPVADLQV